MYHARVRSLYVLLQGQVGTVPAGLRSWETPGLLLIHRGVPFVVMCAPSSWSRLASLAFMPPNWFAYKVCSEISSCFAISGDRGALGLQPFGLARLADDLLGRVPWSTGSRVPVLLPRSGCSVSHHPDRPHGVRHGGQATLPLPRRVPLRPPRWSRPRRQR